MDQFDNEYDRYLANRGTASLAPTPVQQEMNDFNKQLSDASDDEYTQYLNKRNGLTPEKRARMEAKLAAHGSTDRFKAGSESDLSTSAPPSSPDDNYGAAITRAVSAGLSDVADAATLGGYKRARNAIIDRYFPETAAAVHKAEDEFHAPIDTSSDVNFLTKMARAGQIAESVTAPIVGASLGAPGLIGRTAGAAFSGVSNPLIRYALGGAAAGGATSGAESAIAGHSLGDIAKDTGLGAAAGGAIGGALGAAGKVLSRAPARAVEREMAGLTEDVGQRTRITKFLPKKEQITAELSHDDGIRRAIHSDAEAALPTVENRLKQIADTDLNPFYQEMEHFGVDGIDPRNKLIRNLTDVKNGFTKHAEGAQRAAVDNIIDGFIADAQQNGGKIPAELLRREATAFQNQGFANMPQFEHVNATKEAKQAIGGAIRDAIADHVSRVYTAGDAADRFRAANQRVSTWYAIRDLMAEKVKRLQTDSPTLMNVIRKGSHFLHNAPMALAPYLQPAAEGIDQRVIAPLVRSGVADSAAQAVGQQAPVIGSSLLEQVAAQKRLEEEANNPFGL